MFLAGLLEIYHDHGGIFFSELIGSVEHFLIRQQMIEPMIPVYDHCDVSS